MTTRKGFLGTHRRSRASWGYPVSCPRLPVSLSLQFVLVAWGTHCRPYHFRQLGKPPGSQSMLPCTSSKCMGWVGEWNRVGFQGFSSIDCPSNHPKTSTCGPFEERVATFASIVGGRIERHQKISRRPTRRTVGHAVWRSGPGPPPDWPTGNAAPSPTSGRTRVDELPPRAWRPPPERTPHTACDKIANGDQVATSCGFHRSGPREKKKNTEVPARRQRRGTGG